MEILKRRIILASKSPRRSHLLREAGFSNFEIRALDVDESWPEEMPVDEVAPYLAEKKAMASRGFLEHPEEVLIAADSVVILGNRIFGKPVDYDDALSILRALSGRVHRVITGVCLLSLNKKRVFADVASVHFLPLSDEEIRYYLDHYAPFDKAGAYAIQEWVGLCKIEKIEGTYSNIMGLPMERLYGELMKF
jgi:septum formation protein